MNMGSNGRNLKVYFLKNYSVPFLGLPLVREKSGKFKVREKSGNCVLGSGKFGILRKVREIQENPLKVREI